MINQLIDGFQAIGILAFLYLLGFLIFPAVAHTFAIRYFHKVSSLLGYLQKNYPNEFKNLESSDLYPLAKGHVVSIGRGYPGVSRFGIISQFPALKAAEKLNASDVELQGIVKSLRTTLKNGIIVVCIGITYVIFPLVLFAYTHNIF